MVPSRPVHRHVTGRVPSPEGPATGMATSHADLLSYQESRWLLIAPFPASCIAEYVSVRTLNCSLCVAGLTSYDDSLLMALSASAQRQFAPVWSWIPDLFLLLCETPI
jgi:hypothetical protein